MSQRDQQGEESILEHVEAAEVRPGSAAKEEGKQDRPDGEKTIPEGEVAPEQVPGTEDEEPSSIEGTA